MRAVSLLGISAALSVLAPVAAPLAAQSDLSVALDQIAQSELTSQHIPGMAVAVVRQGRLVYAEGFGTESLETHTPVTADTLFRVGSDTKMFVAAAVVKLAREGRLRLDAPVGNYILGLNPQVAALTAHQLLTHTAGLIDASRSYGPHDDSALEKNVASWTPAMFLTEPGKVLSYSDAGYALAGRLIEVVKGEPFANALEELILRPLGMQHTTFRPTVAMTYPVAEGHTGDGKVVRPNPDNAADWPARFLFTSAIDYARFMSAFVNGGKLDPDNPEEPEAISSAVFDAMAKPYVAEPGLAGRSYGYGLEIDSSRGMKLVSHGGRIDGYASFMVMAPEFKTGVIVLTNRDGADARTVARSLLERALPVSLGPPAAAPPAAAGGLTQYQGKYVNGGASVEIGEANGKLTAKTVDEPLPFEPAGGACFARFSTTLCFTPGFAHLGLRAYKKQ